jgi:cytochrome c oxidase subunit 3
MAMATTTTMAGTEGLARDLVPGDDEQNEASATSPLHPVGGGPPRARKKLFSNGVFAMGLFIVAETMFFVGMMSAFTIARASAVGGLWPPMDQPRLPWRETLFNSAALMLSGIVCFLAWRAFKAGKGSVRILLPISLGLGTIFVVMQGQEWAALLNQGLTMQSSQYGSFFYLVVGTHALHAIAALLAMAHCTWLLFRSRLTATAFSTMQLFWYFVVFLWPLLYWKVYL